jgi:hypothetical protein
MNRNVVSLFRLAHRSQDWTNQELAEFYRVEASLVRGGFSVETDRGQSDEGDPWFIFSRTDTDDVIIHFARIDGGYIVASPALGKCARGPNFRALIEGLIESHPLVIPAVVGGGKLRIHPAALLVVLVSTCFFKFYSKDAVAAEHGEHVPPPSQTGLANEDASAAVILNERASATVLAAIAAAVAWGQSGASELTFLGTTLTPNIELPQAAVAPASAASWDSSDGPQTRQFDDHSAATGSVPEVAQGSSANRFHPTGNDHFPIGHQFITADVSGPSAVIAFLSTQSVAVSHSDQSLQFSTLGGNTLMPLLALTTGAAPSTMIASVEVSAAVGPSFQTHLVTDLSGSEQKLVLSVATHAASFDYPAASGSGGESASPSNHGATPPTAHSTDTSTINASSTASVGATPPQQTATVNSAPEGSGVNSLQFAETAIQHFIAIHPDFQIINYNKEIIIYDPHLTPSNLPTASEHTFDFQDGSSVVLIGLPPSETATHLPA